MIQLIYRHLNKKNMINTENIFKENKRQVAFMGLGKQGNKIFCTVKKDGTYVNEIFFLKDKDYHKELIFIISQYAKKNKLKIYSIGLAGFSDFENIATKFWQILDIFPKKVLVSGKKHRQNAILACQEAESLFNDELVPNIFFDKYGCVREQFLTNLKTYQNISQKEDWNKIIEISKQCK